MTDMNFKTKKVKMGMFDFHVYFVFSKDTHRVARYVNNKMPYKTTQKVAVEDGDFECLGKCFGAYGYVPIIWMPRKPQTVEEQGTLAHECLHAVGWLVRWANIRYDCDNDEVFCHALKHLYVSALS